MDAGVISTATMQKSPLAVMASPANTWTPGNLEWLVYWHPNWSRTIQLICVALACPDVRMALAAPEGRALLARLQ